MPLRVACLLFLLSGASSLIFEVAWVKLLTLQFGSSAWSISTVVASFMAGLALGSAWAGRRADRIERPFAAYAALELGIALFGLASVPILHRMDLLIAPLYRALAGQFYWFVLLRFAISFVVLLLPTILMGASLPVLVAGLTREQSVRQRVGLLYGINTLGAAAGVVAAGFWLLPRFGLISTTIAAAGLSAVVALAAFAYGRNLRAQPASGSPAEGGSAPWLLLIALAVSGAASIGWEVACVRLLAPILGSSTYAFSIILATFLVGIGAGGLFAASPAAPRQAYRRGLFCLLTVCALTIVGGLFYANHLQGWMIELARAAGREPARLFAAQGLIVGAMLILPATCLGAALPLAIAGWQSETGSIGRAVGGIYSANTLGSILGSLLAGFALLPWLGAGGTILLCAAATQATAVALLLAETSRPLRGRIAAAAASVALFGALALAAPRLDLQALHRGIFRTLLSESGMTATQSGRLLYVREGISATVTIYRSTDVTTLKVNGKSDASTGSDLTTQYLLGHLPAFFSARPARACVIGYGSGATVRAVATHPDVARVDVVELEPAVAEVSRFFHTINDEVLTDPRVHLHAEDGRAFLRYRPERYDLLISEPSNPWIAGVSALFTREFYQLARSRMNEGGVFCQWIQTYEMSRETLDVMISTLAEVFPNVLFFRSKANLLCLATERPLTGRMRAYQARFEHPDVKQNLARVGITNPYELLMRFEGSLPADAAVWRSARRNTDDNLWLEYRAPLEMYLGTRPKLTSLPAAVYLDRVCAMLFPEQPRSRVAVGLASALASLTPGRIARIDGLAACVTGRPRKQIEQQGLLARERYPIVSGRLQILQQAHEMMVGDLPGGAVLQLRKVLKVLPRDGQAWRLLGQAYVRNRQPGLAVKAFERAIELQREDYLARVHLARLLHGAGREAEAAELLTRAVAINPRSIKAWLARIIYTMLGGDQERALKLVDEAGQALDPRDFEELRRLIAKAALNARKR